MLSTLRLLLLVLIPNHSFQREISLFDYKVTKEKAIGKIYCNTTDIKETIKNNFKSSEYDVALNVNGKSGFYKGGLKETFDLSDNNVLKNHSETKANKLARFKGEIYTKSEGRECPEINAYGTILRNINDNDKDTCLYHFSK